jgi:2-keto-4-pentenoate hydratase
VTRTIGSDPVTADPFVPGQLAAWLRDARVAGTTLRGSADGPQLTLAQAYRVQHELMALHLSSGRELAGYKLGYTSLAMRQQMGVDAPNFGPLYRDMIMASDRTVEGYMQPRLEPEVAVVLSRDLRGHGLLIHEVAQSVGEVRACLEIVDSVWRDYRFSVEQNTADGSSAAGVVLGQSLDVAPVDCHKLSVELSADGQLVGTATGAAASGHPLNGIIWLCAQLELRGRGLKAGQVVITGGLTSAIALRPGSRVQAIYGNGIAVAVTRAG